MGNIDIIMSARTTEVIGDGSKVVGMDYEDRTTGEIKHLAVAGIFVQIGLVPNTEFLKGSEVALTRFGEIEIDTKGATSLPGVYAAGDATTVPFKQIIISMGAGATAALGAFDYLIRNAAPEAAAAKADTVTA
ncbi:NADH dehydrogenase [compost metagenome]